MRFFQLSSLLRSVDDCYEYTLILVRSFQYARTFRLIQVPITAWLSMAGRVQ